jgi:tRNA(Ile)-lysidine synthase
MARQSETTDLHALIDDALARTPPGRVVWVAISGGLDSCLLLTLAAEACRRHPRPLHALHVNHGLQDAAEMFEAHCRRLCTELGVPLFVDVVEVDLNAGQGLEAAAREARYAAFIRRVGEGETLWLAQHRDDQAETFLLAALRGSGVRGLAGMPAHRDWQERRLQRPLLAVSRAELEQEALRVGLDWVEDPSNRDRRLDRNFLRHAVLPLLETRWPDSCKSLARSATLAGEADDLLQELAEQDLARLGGDAGRLTVEEIMALSAPRRRLLIRHACDRLGLQRPPARRLESLLAQLSARGDAGVRIAWEGAEARVWNRQLWLLAPAMALPADWRAEWDGVSPLETPLGLARVGLRGPGGGPWRLEASRRRGGERFHLTGRGRRDLKRLLQEARVPPWRRRQLVVIRQEDDPLGVLDPLTSRWVIVAEGWEGYGQWSTRVKPAASW